MKNFKYKYHCILTDIDNGYVHDILLSAKYGFLHRYFMEYPLLIRKQVRYICTDMRSGFSKIARNCFPNAKICIDLFHVVKLITEAISSIRTDNWKRLRDEYLKKQAEADELKGSGNMSEYTKKLSEAKQLEEDCSLIKCSQKLLVTSPYNSNAYWNQHYNIRDEKLADIFSKVPSLETAYSALMDFYDLSAVPSFSARHKLLDEWLENYMSVNCPQVKQAAYSINKHRNGIENSWRYKKSNGPTEGLNKKIKDCKRLAFGAHDFVNFRSRVMLACGSGKIIKSSYTVFDEKSADKTDTFTKEKHKGVSNDNLR